MKNSGGGGNSIQFEAICTKGITFLALNLQREKENSYQAYLDAADIDSTSYQSQFLDGY